MTVKEYLKMTKGISEVSIKDSKGEYIEINVDAVKIVSFVDEEIKEVEVYSHTKKVTLNEKETSINYVSVNIVLANIVKGE